MSMYDTVSNCCMNRLLCVYCAKKCMYYLKNWHLFYVQARVAFVLLI